MSVIYVRMAVPMFPLFQVLLFFQALHALSKLYRISSLSGDQRESCILIASHPKRSMAARSISSIEEVCDGWYDAEEWESEEVVAKVIVSGEENGCAHRIRNGWLNEWPDVTIKYNTFTTAMACRTSFVFFDPAHRWLKAIVFYTVTILAGSLLSHIFDPPNFYFTEKRNIFNVVFVRNGGYLIFIMFITHMIRHKFNDPRALYRFSFATIWYVFMTRWCLGPSISTRILQATSRCVPDTGYYLGDGMDTAENISLGSRSCSVWLDVTLGMTCLLPGQTGLNMVMQVCRAARGALGDGHDLSGHIFFLTFGSIFVLNEYQLVNISHYRSWVIWLVLIIWWWMMLITSIYFHTFAEKVGFRFQDVLTKLTNL